MRKRTFFTMTAGCLLAVPLVVGGHMLIGQMRGNFHEVIEGELYRSAQPSGEAVGEMAAEYGIRTIVNLRDEARGPWYEAEHAAAAQHGITMIDFPMSSSVELPVEQSAALAELMRAADKPILIHCEHGANRTGLAAAIYVGAVAERSELFSEFQLSPYYGHVPIPGIGRYAMYKSWDDFEEKLGF